MFAYLLITSRAEWSNHFLTVIAYCSCSHPNALRGSHPYVAVLSRAQLQVETPIMQLRHKSYPTASTASLLQSELANISQTQKKQKVKEKVLDAQQKEKQAAAEQEK